MGVPVKELEETTTTTVRDMSQSLYRQKHQNYHPEQSDYSLLISSPLFLKKKKILQQMIGFKIVQILNIIQLWSCIHL